MTLSVGQKASRSLTLTAEHVAKYAEMTGDYNPLHFDADFAAGTKFGGLVVQGGLTTGVLNALVAMDMPGPGTVFLSHDIKFTAPVFIGDTITVTYRIEDIDPARRRATSKVEVTNHDGEMVAVANHIIKWLKKPES